MADDKDIVVEFLNSKSASKSKFYFKDFTDLFPDKGPRDVKKILTKLVNEEVLEFWSSGSTTMYGLKGAGKQSHAEGEDYLLIFLAGCGLMPDFPFRVRGGSSASTRQVLCFPRTTKNPQTPELPRSWPSQGSSAFA